MLLSIVEELRLGADAIEQGFWYQGVFGRVGGSARFVTAGAVSDSIPPGVRGGCLYTVLSTERAISALQNHLGVRTNEDVYRINDSQPLETGRQWAIDTLRAAADAEEARLAQPHTQ